MPIFQLRIMRVACVKTPSSPNEYTRRIIDTFHYAGNIKLLNEQVIGFSQNLYPQSNFEEPGGPSNGDSSSYHYYLEMLVRGKWRGIKLLLPYAVAERSLSP